MTACVEPSYRCIGFNNVHAPSPWLRMIYRNRDRIEHFVRAIHNRPVAYSTPQLMLLSHKEFIDRAHRDLMDLLARRFWDDPIV